MKEYEVGRKAQHMWMNEDLEGKHRECIFTGRLGSIEYCFRNSMNASYIIYDNSRFNYKFHNRSISWTKNRNFIALCHGVNYEYAMKSKAKL